MLSSVLKQSRRYSLLPISFVRTYSVGVRKNLVPALQIQKRNMSRQATQDQSNMSVIDIIKQDHRDVLDQHNIYKSSTNLDQKKHTAKMAIKLLSVHSVCEEQIVYPAFRKKIPGGDRIADQSIEEHQELKNDLYDLDKMDLSDPGFDAKFNKVMDDLNNHGLIHEEQEFLPMFSKYCTQEELINMGRDFVAQRASAPTHPHPSAPANPYLQKAAAAVTTPFDKMKDAAEGV